MPSANEITAALLLETPRRFSGRAWIYRNNRVDAKVIRRGGKMGRVSAGINGQGDLSGILTVSHAGREFGVRLELEVKAGADRIRPSQAAFRARVLRMGGIYIVVRSVEQGLADLAAVVCGCGLGRARCEQAACPCSCHVLVVG